MGNFVLTIGNPDIDGMAKAVREVGVENSSLILGEGMYLGKPEPMAQLTLYGVDNRAVVDFLNIYGMSHRSEKVFGIMPMAETYLHDNPYFTNPN